MGVYVYMDKNTVVLAGIIVIGAILIVALYMGIDGVLLASGLGVIASIISYIFGLGKAVAKVDGVVENKNMLPVNKSNIVISYRHDDWIRHYIPFLGE